MGNIKLINSVEIPHPFPYQGSKRGIAKYILPYFPSDVGCLIEPFCGAGAVSIAAAANGLANKIVLNDLNKPLMDLWREIIENPGKLCDEYERLWFEQQEDQKAFFYKIRSEFNQSKTPYQLLYLLARIVKGSVRYSSVGQFNQSADNRRSGMKPSTMRKNILGVSNLLRNKVAIVSTDFREVVKKTNDDDLIYMDPPYQGTSFTRDHRYLSGLSYDDFVDTLLYMNAENLSYIISYDGTTGEKAYGKSLPLSLRLKHIYISAGRSSQATLLGKNQETIESLYLSPALVERLSIKSVFDKTSCFPKQKEFVFS
jgi:DNA adenine methylase